MDHIGAEGFDSWYRLHHPRVPGVLVALSGDTDLSTDATEERERRGAASPRSRQQGARRVPGGAGDD